MTLIHSFRKPVCFLLFILCLGVLVSAAGCDDNNGSGDPAQEDPVEDIPGDIPDGYNEIHLSRTITGVQPFTGIVFWADSDHASSRAIQLEYAYVPYNSIVSTEDTYTWDGFETLLNQIAGRGHQAIIRFYYVYPGEQTTVPDYIKALGDYHETQGTSEGEPTGFPDWSHDELKSFTLEFYTQFSQRYDQDQRIAYLQTGFGLWGEYHIYDGPMVLGGTFPAKSYQDEFIRHVTAAFDALHVSISIDAADEETTPFSATPALLNLDFGLFDDSFLHEEHGDYNADCFQFFGVNTRYTHSPMGGELSYYSDYDQEHALDLEGPYGIPFESLAATYHISYMIGNDQPDYQVMSRIEQAGMALGYCFQVTRFVTNGAESLVTVKNTGIAPIYYDAYVTVNNIRSSESLKGLLPGQSHEYAVTSGGENPDLTITCDRLVTGQAIQFEADL